jgi:serine/threonine protein kinase
LTVESTDLSTRRRFHFRSCLGRGGFGEVYLASLYSPGGLKTEVAVKVLVRDVDPQSQAIQRLRDEARVLAMLRHTAILTVHDLLVLDGRVALVTEYVEGADLHHCIRGDDALSHRALVHVIELVADALDAAYNTPSDSGERLALVHRDIKPANIRLTTRGDVKVLDFGLARASFGMREAETRTTVAVGSPQYMAPERFDSTAEDTPAGDVFGLGCVLYEGLAHERLFDGATTKRMYQMAFVPESYEDWVGDRLGKLQDLPVPLAELLRSMLSHDPTKRPSPYWVAARCEELREQLKGTTLRRWARAHRWPKSEAETGSLDGKTLIEAAISASQVMSSGLILPPRGSIPGSFVDPEEVDEEVDEPPPPWRKLGLLVVAGALAVGLVAVLVIGVLGALGVMVLAPLSASAPATVPVSQTAAAQTPAPLDAAPLDGSAVAEAVEGSAVSGDGDVVAPDASTELSGSQPEVSVPTSAEVPGGCGALPSLEESASKGALAASARSCLDGHMRDQKEKLTERDRFGRLLLVDGYTRCVDTGDCADYEKAQVYFHAEIGQYDPTMSLRWAQHLFKSGVNTPAEADEVIRWTRRAQERRTQWKGADFVRSTELAHELQARASYAAWSKTRDGSWRTQARDSAVDWVNYRLRLGRDEGPGFELCASVMGSHDTCKRRFYDANALFTVSFASVPLGAQVTLDGTRLGSAPINHQLKAGSYEVSVGDGVRTVIVGAGEPVRYMYIAGSKTWKEHH